MPVTEAKKAANKRWDSENMKYQTVKVPARLLEEFRQAVQDRGDKVNTVLREAMERYTAGETAHGCNVPAAPGGVALDDQTAAEARQAAEAHGEQLDQWIARAVRDTAQRDRFARMLKR